MRSLTLLILLGTSFSFNVIGKEAIHVTFPELEDKKISLRLKKSVIAEILHSGLDFQLGAPAHSEKRQVYHLKFIMLRHGDGLFTGDSTLLTPKGVIIKEPKRSKLNNFQLVEYYLKKLKVYLGKISDNKDIID